MMVAGAEVPCGWPGKWVKYHAVIRGILDEGKRKSAGPHRPAPSPPSYYPHPSPIDLPELIHIRTLAAGAMLLLPWCECMLHQAVCMSGGSWSGGCYIL